jgi:hypothetical protein
MNPMNPVILNKRKTWLSEPAAKNDLDKWTKAADSEKDVKKYFGIKGSLGQDFSKDDNNTNYYFKKSLALFKKAVELQKNGNAEGLPKLEIVLHYDALITIVGFSPEPLLHTILSLAPSSVYPIATKESASKYGVANIENNSNLQYFEIIVELYKELEQTIVVKPIGRAVESIGAINTFKRVREIIAEIKKEKSDAKIALDITGGKKSADASAFLTVAIEKDIDIFYVDFEEYEDGKPKCGTEFLNKLDNPYDIYNIDLINQAKELFRNYNYAAAKSIFEKVESNLRTKAEFFGLKSELNAVEKMKKAAECLLYWDKFNFGKCESTLDVLPEAHRDLFEKSAEKSAARHLYETILNLLLNAKRLDVQLNRNDAIIRLGQALEYLLSEENNTRTLEQMIDDAQLTYKMTDEMKNNLHVLRRRRNKFVHDTETVGAQTFQKAFITMKHLCVKIIPNLTIDKIEQDLRTYAFPTEFNDDGTLKFN